MHPLAPPPAPTSRPRRRARRRTVGVTALVVTLLLGSVASEAPSAAAGSATAVGTEDVQSSPAGELRSSEHLLGAAGRSGDSTVGPGWSAVVDVAPGTQMVGLTWHGPAEAAVEIRADDGRDGWGDWTDLHGDAGTDAADRPGAGPAWLGSAGTTRVEVRVETGTLADLRLESMRWVPRTGGARALTVDRPATAAGGPPIITRSSWAPGGWQPSHRGCTPAPEPSDQLRFGVVHHTATANGYSANDVAGILAGIYRFHTDGRGWCDIAYNFFVDRFGRAWQGRSGSLHDPIKGGHAKGFNTHSVGISLLGSHQSTSPTAAARTTLRDLLAWKLGAHGVNPQISIPIVSGGSTRYPAGQTVSLPTIQGHRDSGQTTCPGSLAYGLLAGLRRDVAARIASTTSASAWAPTRSGPAYFGRLYRSATGRTVRNGLPGRDTSLVVRAGWSRNALATSIVVSTGTDARVGSIDRLYRAAFHRNPDRAGLRSWVSQRDFGMTLSGVARRFTITSEFRAIYDGLDDVDAVAELYRNVLGREPDRAGAAYWERRLAEGLTRHQLLASMSESREHRSRTWVQAEISAAYFVVLDRAPSSGERTDWSTLYRAGARGDSLVPHLIGSSEYAAGA